MKKPWIDPGKASSATALTASRKPKPKTYVVSDPLPPSRISWLRRQSKRVAEASTQRLGNSGKKQGGAARVLPHRLAPSPGLPYMAAVQRAIALVEARIRQSAQGTAGPVS